MAYNRFPKSEIYNENEFETRGEDNKSNGFSLARKYDLSLPNDRLTSDYLNIKNGHFLFTDVKDLRI